MLDIRRRTGYLFLAVVLGHIILISAQVNTASGVRVLQAVTFSIYAEVQRGVSFAVGGLRGVWENYIALWHVQQENQQLKEELASLQIRMQQLRALAQRGQRLEALLALDTRVTPPTLAAAVIAGDATAWFRTITIDRGSQDGITADMAVIAPAGAVGRILDSPSRRAARVQLLIDRNAAAAALIERTRVGGLVLGAEGDPPLRMDYVSNLADVKPGDTVVTSGLDGIYPPGFAIGRVERVANGSGLYKEISVRPAVDFSALEEVLVVLQPPRPAGGEGTE